MTMSCSLHSFNSEQDEDEDVQGDQQKLIKGKSVHGKKRKASQLVQEEKAETGSVCLMLKLKLQAIIFILAHQLLNWCYEHCKNYENIQ